MIASRVPCDVNFYVEILSDNSLEQVVCTCAFSPGKGQWCHTAGKVTVGLALLWPCATDLSHRLKVHVQAFFCKSLQTSVTLINGSLPTPAVGACRVISGICDCVVSVCVHALKGKRLELSTQNLVDLYSMAGVQHALMLRSKRQS